MNILIIPDKFKGSLSTTEVIASIKQGIFKVSSNIKTYDFILSDGGDGFLNAVNQYINSETIELKSKDPLGNPIRSHYLIDSSNSKAYIELSNASGMQLLKVSQLNVMKASTYGTGIQIQDAINRGVKSIYIGLGGSATNDAGLGIAQALGYKFYNDSYEEISPNGENLLKIKDIAFSKLKSKIKKVSFYAVNDVDNILYGKNGAAYVYAKQKGANEDEIKILDKGLKNISKVIEEKGGKDCHNIPGSGAAGGTAYGLKTFFDAQLINGIDFLLELSKVKELLNTKTIDLIITGEGKLDNQTKHGKLIKGISDLGKTHKTPVIAICGKSTLSEKEIEKLNLKEVLQLKNVKLTDDYCMINASELIKKRIFNHLQEYLGS